MIKTLKANIEMVQVPYDRLGDHVGEKIWFSPTPDHITVHGPCTIERRTTGLVLSGREPINVADLHLNTFWQPLPLGTQL